MGAVGQALQALGLVASQPALDRPPAHPPLAGHFHHRPALPDHVQHRLIPLLSHAHVPHAGQHGPRCDTSTEVAATHQPKVWDTSGEGPMRHITRTRTGLKMPSAGLEPATHALGRKRPGPLGYAGTLWRGARERL